MARTNVRRLRPTEVKAVAEALVEEHEDVEELAKDICRAINRMRATEPNWVRVVQHGSGYLMYGPYRSAEEAREDDASRGPSREEQVSVATWSLIPPYGQAEQEASEG